MTFKAINSEMVKEFLEWIENTCGCSVTTRNQRLAALRSFFEYAGLKDISVMNLYFGVHDIPIKKAQGKIVEYLSESALETLLKQPDLKKSKVLRDLKLSEQAAVLAMRHSKMFSEAKRQAIVDELYAIEVKAKSKLEQTGEEYGLKKDTVARLLRIDKLVEELKPWIDSKQLAVRAAVEISFIPEDGQKLIYEAFKGSDDSMIDKIDTKKAKALRQTFEKSPDMSEDNLLEFVTDKKNENIGKI